MLQKGTKCHFTRRYSANGKIEAFALFKELEFERACLSSSTPFVSSIPFVLYNLQTMSQVRPSSSTIMPNLVNLGCHLTLSDATKYAQFPDLSRLRMLETLTFDYQTLNMAKFFLPQPSKFPPNLRK